MDSSVKPARSEPSRFGRKRLRRLSAPLLLLTLMATAWWAWLQPAMAYPRMWWHIMRTAPPLALSVPVSGVAIERIADTWGAARGERPHQGVDIFAPRGTPICSTTRGIVWSVRNSGLGGKQIWVIGPGRERHYYAHLEDWVPGLARGDVVQVGDRMGFVGNSGNAQGTPPHLHYGIYGTSGALDPLPRLRAAPALQAIPDPGACAALNPLPG